MGKTDPSAPPHAQQSMILVPMTSPGVRIIRPMMVYGYDDAPHGHAEVHFEDVKVPAGELLCQLNKFQFSDWVAMMKCWQGLYVGLHQ